MEFSGGAQEGPLRQPGRLAEIMVSSMSLIPSVDWQPWPFMAGISTVSAAPHRFTTLKQVHCFDHIASLLERTAQHTRFVPRPELIQQSKKKLLAKQVQSRQQRLPFASGMQEVALNNKGRATQGRQPRQS